MSEYEASDISVGRIDKETLKSDVSQPTCHIYETGITYKIFQFQDGTVKGKLVIHCYDSDGKPYERDILDEYLLKHLVLRLEEKGIWKEF